MRRLAATSKPARGRDADEFWSDFRSIRVLQRSHRAIEQEWALAHRVNAGEGGVVIFPGIFGSPIDPSTPMEDRDVTQLGTGLWNRMLIDATRSWKSPRRPEWVGERFPPTVRPSPDDEARVRERWSDYGLGDL